MTLLLRHVSAQYWVHNKTRTLCIYDGSIIYVYISILTWRCRPLERPSPPLLRGQWPLRVKTRVYLCQRDSSDLDCTAPQALFRNRRWVSPLQQCDLCEETGINSSNSFTLNRWQAITRNDDGLAYRCIHTSPGLTHLPLNKMAVISQTFQDHFYEWKVLYFDAYFISLFLKVSLTINQHWFR